MSFLGAIFLIALPLAAVPILIHLYRGRQRDVIFWGATQFLEKALTKGRSWERLEEILLMLLRTATVLALIFALARPMISSNWWGGSGRSEVVLLLDNSLSMGREVDDQSAEQRLREEANEVLADLSAEHTVHLMLAAGGGEWLTAEGVRMDEGGRERLAAEIEAIEPTQGSSNLLSNLLTIVQMDSGAEPFSRRVVVLTDNQSSAWQLDAGAAWDQLQHAIAAAKVPTTVQVVDCSAEDKESDNLAVVKFECSRHVAQPGDTIECRADVQNMGSNPQDQGLVEWLVNGEKVATSEIVSLDPAETLRVVHNVKLEKEGATLVACRLVGEDELRLDQQAQMVVEVVDKLPILVVEKITFEGTEKSSGTFFAAALGYDRQEPLEWHSLYQPKFIAPEDFADANLAEYRAIVFTDLTGWDENTAERLRDFVREGGGLWIALNDSVDRAEFNRLIYDDGDGLSPLSLAELHESEAVDEDAAQIHPPEQGHPATAQLGNITQLDIDEARVLVHWQFTPRDSEDKVASALLETGSGEPLVVENYLGQGKVIVQSFPLGLEWSNLPRLKSYVVMVADWLDYLTASSAQRHNPAVGGPLVANLPDSIDPETVRLVLPAGNSIEDLAREEEGGYAVRYWRTQLPGVYQVVYEDGDETRSIPFQVARDPVESRLTFLDESERAKIADSGVVEGDELPPAAETAQADSQREPLWRALLVGLIVFLALELLLSSWLTTGRSAPVLTEQLV